MYNDNMLAIFIIFLFCICSYSFYQFLQKEKTIMKKNKYLFEFHLNSKFLNKLLIESLRVSSSADFCPFLIEQIKDYYNLQEIIIIDSVESISEYHGDTIKSSAIQFVKKDIVSLTRMLSGHHIKQFSININDRNYILYISKLTTIKQSDGVIICIEHAPCLLSTSDKIGLENSIILLKNRLFYD